MAAKKPTRGRARTAAGAAPKDKPWQDTFRFTLTETQRRKLAKIFPHPVFLRAKYDARTRKLVVTGVSDSPVGANFVPSNSAFAQ